MRNVDNEPTPTVKLVLLLNEKSARFSVCRNRIHSCVCGYAWSADANSDADGQDRALDRAARAKFRERSIHSIVDRRQARCRYTAESTLWGNCFGRATYDNRPRSTQHAVTSSDFGPVNS